MNTNRSAEIFPKKVEPIRNVSGEECRLPPWLFKHQDLVHALENAKSVDQKDLTNTLNHIHFMDGYILNANFLSIAVFRPK